MRSPCPLCLCHTASVALKSSKTSGHKPLPSVGCPSQWMGLRGAPGYRWAGGKAPQPSLIREPRVKKASES